MKNVDVAWRLIDVTKEWQKLKTEVCYFGIQVLNLCLSSWVLATAAIGFTTKEKKVVYHIDQIVR